MRNRNWLEELLCFRCIEDINSNKIEIESLEEEVLNLQKEKNEIKTQLELLKQNQSTETYKGKHTEAKITYQRQIMVDKKTYEDAKIDVRQFITPNNFIIYEDINKNNLFIDGAVKLNKLIPKLYQLAKTKYKYEYDINNFGMSEFWLFPFETQVLLEKGKGLDCDDWSHLIGSYLACAGVPRDRWWVSCGNTRDGFGHSTVYVKDDEGRWRHLNSTAKWYKYDNLNKYPINTDEKDLIGIKDFWFSFNDYYSISDFETACADISFNKTKEVKNIQIRSKE